MMNKDKMMINNDKKIVNKKFLIINGSPRKNGTSCSFARTIRKLAEEKNCAAEIFHVHELFAANNNWTSFKNAVGESAVIVLVSPLYVDTLPYPVVRLFEKMCIELRQVLCGKSFFAVGQCGFPDTTMLEPFLGSCRFFAEQAGMQWRGGLGYGGGSIINGAHLEDLGKKGGKIISAFALALDDVLSERTISSAAQDLLAVKIPALLLYPLAAFLNHKARKGAKKHRVDLTRKTYLKE